MTTMCVPRVHTVLPATHTRPTPGDDDDDDDDTVVK